MNEKTPLHCAQCGVSLEGRTVFATGGHSFCDNGTCKDLFAIYCHEARAHPPRTYPPAQLDLNFADRHYG